MKRLTEMTTLLLLTYLNCPTWLCGEVSLHLDSKNNNVSVDVLWRRFTRDARVFSENHGINLSIELMFRLFNLIVFLCHSFIVTCLILKSRPGVLSFTLLSIIIMYLIQLNAISSSEQHDSYFTQIHHQALGVSSLARKYCKLLSFKYY